MKRHRRSQFSFITKWHKLQSTPVNFFSSAKPLPPKVVKRPSADPTSCGNGSPSSCLTLLRRSCRNKGLKYSLTMAGESDESSGMGRSWQSTFSAESREAAEARMNELGYSWQWQPNGDLRATTPVLPAVRDLGDGRSSFFNQLIAAFKGWKDTRNDPSKAITFGDGTPLDPDDVAKASELADEVTFDIPWQDGDLALVDNYTAMHGRRTFSGTRKVLASLVAA